MVTINFDHCIPSQTDGGLSHTDSGCTLVAGMRLSAIKGKERLGLYKIVNSWKIEFHHSVQSFKLSYAHIKGPCATLVLCGRVVLSEHAN